MKQPTALRLAEALYAVPETGGMPDDIQAAADELVRLHEANQSMLEALKLAEEFLGSFVSDHGWSQSDMNKEDALKMIKLLSALESWSFSANTDLPDYLHEDLSLALEKLEKIVLKEQA
jgi:hypothetical protein